MREGGGGSGGGGTDQSFFQVFCLGHRWLVSPDYVPPAVFSPGDARGATIYY